MCVDGEDFNSNYHYLGFNDLGNYIGRIAHRLGLKYGQEGLWYNHYQKDQNLGKVMISKDYREIFKFLDLDYDRWLQGFPNLEDTFEYVLTSKYFDSEMFKLENLNRINRERNMKRTSYMSFLEWIQVNHPEVVGDYLDGPANESRSGGKLSIKALIKSITKAFPDSNFDMKIKELEYTEAKKAYVNAKFNGSIVMKRYGLVGAQIGGSLKDFKHSIEADGYDYADYIINESQENIFEEFRTLIEDN